MSRKRTRVRFESDAGRVAEWIATNGYAEWATEEFLRDRCVRLRCERGDQTVAYYWMHWSDVMEGVLVIHACAAPEWHGRWMDPNVIAKVFSTAELMGAKYLLSEPSPTAPPSLHRLYRRLGFAEPRPGVFIAPV